MVNAEPRCQPPLAEATTQGANDPNIGHCQLRKEAPMDIYGASHRLQVLRPYTGAIAAKVIRLETDRYCAH
jgi:hypothetical protein